MSATIRYPAPTDGTSVSIAGSFNNWQPEPMTLSKDGRNYEKSILKEDNGPDSHDFKFVLGDGEWTLEDGRATVANQDGVLNHRIELKSSILESVLSDDVVTNAQGGEKDHLAPPESVSVTKDLGTEAIDKATKNNEYPADARPATSSGLGLVDPDDSKIRVGDRTPSTTTTVSHDSHLNPAAPAFNPVAAPFIPASNGPRHSHSNSRSSHRQRSQSRSRNSHSRSSSIVSNRQRSNSSIHHEELNPAAHEFRPQFAQPTNHIPYASGYAAALKKPASPPIKEEFKKPQLPAKHAPTHSNVAASGQEARHSPTKSPSHSTNQADAATPISYAAIAKHGTSDSGSDTNSIQPSTTIPQVSETKQRSAVEQHKDPVLTMDVIQAGQKSSGSVLGPPVLEDAKSAQADAKDLQSAVQESAATIVRDVENVTSAAKSEASQVQNTMLDPAIESLKHQSSEQPFSADTAAPSNTSEKRHKTVAETAHANTQQVQNSQHDESSSQHIMQQDSQLPGQEIANNTAESFKSSMQNLQEQAVKASQLGKANVQPVVDQLKENLSDIQNKVSDTAGAMKESLTDTAVSMKEAISTEQTPSSKTSPESSGLASTNAQIDTINLSSAEYDAEQIRLMEEVCILLDRDDKPIGSATKKDAHLMSNINDGLLHRAFSLFIFNSENKLLLQQRASEKITFPDMWTNTCCSHPLDISGENSSSLQGAIAGVKQAAQRKVDQELGISAEDARVADMTFLTRIHYLAPSDGKWGEHEIDYILFLRSSPSLSINPNEVKDHKWVSQADLRKMFNLSDLSYTPWFKLICETFLYKWWDNLDDLTVCKDETTIHRMGIESDLYERIQHTDKSPGMSEESLKTSKQDGFVRNAVAQATSTIQAGSAKVVSAVSHGSEAVLEDLTNLPDRVAEQVSSIASSTKEALSSDASPIDTSEPAAEDTLPVGFKTQEPDFEPSTVHPAPATSTIDESAPISEESEPAAEDSSLAVPESKDEVESEIQESLNATRTEADSTQSAKTPDAVLELSPAGEAKAAAHAKQDPNTVSRNNTSKSIRAKQNFFFYIFNSLFGGIFRGFSSIFHKLAFWRSNPRQEQD